MTVTQLDYPKTKVLIDASTQIELSYRVNCTAKESFTVDFIDAMEPGSVFYDVGANVGSYTLIAAARGIATIAIEPGAANYNALIRNLFLNNFDERVTPFCAGLADITGLTWFDYQDVAPGGANHVLGSPRKVFFHRQLIPVWRLDDLIARFELPAPTHIKIDVDGNGDVELAVLQGMAGVLAGDALKGLMIEMPLSHEAQIVEALKSQGWAMAQRFDERGGHKIANICYGSFQRVAVAAMPEMIGAAA